ncbi:hypothetical protein ACFYOY_13700 [Streptomyces sp. NPDC007875]|uniref:DUF6197 family protein n=1 Tax=Streptomyces sp. NPDC007875 TaxID=3364783 RepID=UPI003687A1CF
MTALITDFAATYREAAGIIRANGHNKGYWYPMAETEIAPAECPVDAGGAISIALTGAPKPARRDVPLVEAAARRFMEHLRPGYKRSMAIWDLGRWNDAEERTAAGVILAFKDAARAEETVEVAA